MSFSAPRNVMVIGLGGTGKWVLTYLKKSLIEASNDYLLKTLPLDKTLDISRAYFDERYNSEIPDGIKLLGFDLDRMQKPDIDGGTFYLNYDPINSPEFASFNQPIFDSIEEVRANKPVPQLGNWLESDDAKQMTVPRTMDEMGAGLQKQYTRSCLLLSMADANNQRKLPSLIDSVIADFQGRRIVNQNLATYFFVVGSLAGGTGAGCFLDVAQIIRQRYAAAGLPSTKIFGIFVLSQAFNLDLTGAPESMSKAKGNAFASMRELRRFMLLTNYGYPFDEFKGNFNPTKPPLTDSHPPFDMCMFLDGTGYTINTEKAQYGVFPAIADFLLTYCVEDKVIDPANLLDAIKKAGAPYGTFGIHSIIYPVEDVIQTFAHKLSLELQDSILRPMPSEFNMQAEVKNFLDENQQYYGQNAPINPTTHQSEFVIADPAQNENLNLLKEIWRLNQMGTEGQSFELDYYQATLNLPKRFRNTGNRDTDFEDLNLSEEANNRWGMPVVNIDLNTREEIDDTFENHSDIVNNYSENGQQANVVKKVNQLCDINLGTDRVSAWRRGSTDYKSYHGVMKYYSQKIEEIYDGYDADGVHYPGLLENKLWMLLNEKVGERDVVDAQGNPVMNFYRTANLREGIYRFKPAGIETALHFCDAVAEQIRQYKEKVDTAYKQHLSIYTEGLQGLEKEVTEAQEAYEHGSWFLGGKGRRYFEKKYQWLVEKRREIVHSYFLKILDNLIQITLEWKTTIDNFKKNVVSVKANIEQSQQNLKNIREDKKKNKVRTYLSEPGDASEEALYATLMSERVETRIVSGNPVNVHRRDKFFETIYIKTIPDATPDNKTGRKFIPDFTFDDHQPELYTKEDALRNALPYCDKVREQKFWELIQTYQDDAGAFRYKANADNQAPQLVTDLGQKTKELVNYQRGQNEPHSEQDDKFCYADWQTGAPPTPENYSQNLRSSLEPENTPHILDCLDVKSPDASGLVRSAKGQGHKIVGLRVTNLLVQKSFAEYTTVAGEYRNQIQANIPKHIFLGEKYAARLEREIMEKRLQLNLNLADNEQFYLPLPLIFALDNPKAFDDFLWAGIFGKVCYGVDSKGNDNFYLQDKDGKNVFLTEGDATAEKRGLEWALIKFCSQRDTQYENLRNHIKSVVADEKRDKKTPQNRADYRKFLQEKNNNFDLINQFVVFPGSDTGFRKVVTARHERAVDFAEWGTLEVILKAKLLSELAEL